jgi:tungstate transport system permease protein
MTTGTLGELAAAFGTAVALVAGLDPELIDIVLLSLRVSLTAVFLAALVGMPLGVAVAAFRFPGRRALTVLLNAMMGLPPVVVGLFVYLMLSRSGPFGVLGLLFTPAAMIVAQAVLITPIVAALTRQLAEDLLVEYDDLLRVMGAGPVATVVTLLNEARAGLFTVLLAGFGRAAAEVGAVMIVGGNIDNVTRVMTTAIALETSRGDLPLALGLGLILIALSLAVNALAALVREGTRPAAPLP